MNQSRFQAPLRCLCLAAVALVVTAGTLSAQAAAPVKIAVVDLELVVAQSASGKALQAKLEQFQKDVQTQAEQMQTKARDIQAQIANGANTLSEDKLSQLQKELEDQGIAIRRLRDDKQREGQKMQTEGLRAIEGQLEPVFEAIQNENGYDLILNNVPGVVVMAKETVDITPMVVDRLNAQAAAGG